MDNNKSLIGPAVALLLMLTACNGQTPQEKAATDARAVADVEAAQKVKPPVQPIELGMIDPTVRRLFNLSDTGCAFFTDPNPGAFPMVVIGRGKAVLQLNGEPAIFAADSGSTQLASGIREKYIGRTHWAELTQQPDTLTLRDRFERIVYQARGRLSCQG